MSPIIAIVSSKGQITLPQSVRQSLGLHQGDPVLFEEKDGAIILRKRPKVDSVWAAGLSTTLSEWEDTLDDDL
ncbi:MAG TPA: AbrB/MazE/SpoVT family DNA-binding domain-containing protein [Rectinemataceae bacterium]|nr:AbrB/MazE/SpoVT family DNA-binding domain-containing protein [Rectinemataceae bacterium]